MDFVLKLRKTSTKSEIFDYVRRKWIALTPEEEVRQKFILYLLNVKKIPLSHISVEHSIEFNGMLRRYDIVAFNSEHKPFLVVECKAPHIKLTQQVVEQAARYNSVLKAQFICITNGSEIFVFKIDFTSQQISTISLDELCY